MPTSDSGSSTHTFNYLQNLNRPIATGASSTVGSGISSLHSSASASQYFRQQEKSNIKGSLKSVSNSSKNTKVTQLVMKHSKSSDEVSSGAVALKRRVVEKETSSKTFGSAHSVANASLGLSESNSNYSSRRNKPFPGSSNANVNNIRSPIASSIASSPKRTTLLSVKKYPVSNTSKNSKQPHPDRAGVANNAKSHASSASHTSKGFSPQPIVIQSKSDKSSASSSSLMNTAFSGGCVNVWVRHSIIASILTPKATYGSNATPGRKLGLNSSFNGDVNTSFTSSLNTSFTTPGKKLRNRSGSNIDDMSITSNATDNKSTTGTTSSRWGWVKASLLNNDAFIDSPKKAPRQGQNALDDLESSSSNLWQKQLKSKNGKETNTNEENIKKTSLEPYQRTRPTVVIVKIIDLESEYHGSTVEIPISSLSDSRDTTNTDGNAIESIFGDAIVMANQWPNFTSIPNSLSDSSKEVEEIPALKNTSWASPRGFSSMKVTGKSCGKKEEKKVDSIEESIEIPKDLTNLTHLHEPAVVYCLRYRYAMNEIYTSTGPILLALNPFKEVKSIYGEDLMRRYCERGQGSFGGAVNLKKKRNSSSTIEPKKLPPHVYAVADNAYRSMMRAMEDGSGDGDIPGPDQSILVSGESGAGKTVTTKIIMKYLAALSKRSSSKNEKSLSTKNNWNAKSFHFSSPTTVSGVSNNVSMPATTSSSKRSTNIEQQVLESNPILESFGNARTIKNDNSSRFGKFIEIQFTSIGKLLGASVDSYLLEKVRLIKHSDGERNYHIFYEIMAGASSSEKKQLLLDRASPEDFAMTRSPSGTFKRRDGVRDDITFNALRKAMVTMGFSPSDQINILKIVSAILHLSNLNFLEDSSGCTLDDRNTSLQSVLHLLGVTRDNLDKALCCVNIEAGGEKLVKKLFLSQAMKAKEAMIGSTYGSLFDYLVRRINSCIHGGRRIHDEILDADIANGELPSPSNSESCAAFIGVLDIFGFESFQQNSFEQLCINYCNESLQQQFNKFVFKLEQSEYEREGIQWNFISFPDNQDVLDLIDKKRSGILSILDEQCFLTQCTDQSFAQSVYQKCGSGRNGPFVASTRQMARYSFSIRHYAGPVEYESAGFLEKNKDELPKGINELLRSSQNGFLQHLESVLDPHQSTTSDDIRGKQSSLKRITVGGQFSSQLQELRMRIDTTSPHYIRCLKPNNALEPDNFDSAVIADQLRCAGILEAVRVSRVGYPQRYLHKTFVQRYQVLAMKEMQRRRIDANTNFKSPAGGFGFHGFVPKREKPSPTASRRKNVSNAPEKKLNPEQECKILVSALTKLIVAAQNSVGSEEEEEENIAPAPSRWTSPGKQQKKWSTPGDQSRNLLPNRSLKQGIDLVAIGVQMGKTKVFLRQQAFEVLERMRGRIKSSAATVINSVIRMYLRRKRYIIMRNEYRTRVAQRCRIIRDGGFGTENEIPTDYAHHHIDQDVDVDGSKFDFREMCISLHREEDYGSKEFKWVWVDNRWIKNDDESDEAN